MSFGKSGGTTINQAQPSPEQLAQIRAATDFFTGTIQPAYQQAVGGAQNLYNASAPGVTDAAQNLAGTAGQAQTILGQTGESALNTGITGLENLFGTDYENQQLQTALQPAEAQYQQNLAGLNAGFGGAGQIGSARQALAQTQLAGMTQASQQQAAANIENQIAQQRLSAANSLAGLGQSGLGQAIGAAGQQVTAAQTPQDYYNKYASIIFGTPASSYTGNFSGTQGSTQTANKTSFGISI